MTNYGIDRAATNALINWLLARRTATVAPQDDGSIVLGYGRPMRAIAVALAILATAFLVLGCIAFRDDARALAIGGGIFALMWLGSLHLLHDVFVASVRADRAGLSRKGLFGEARLDWSEVESVRFSESGQWFAFRRAGGPTVRVSLFRDGLVTLSELATTHLDSEPAEAARAVFAPRLPRAA